LDVLFVRLDLGGTAGMARVKFWRPFSGGFNSHGEYTTVTILYHPMPGGYAYVAIRNASAQTHNLFRYIHISLKQHAIYKILASKFYSILFMNPISSPKFKRLFKTIHNQSY
jgi:hypothetical protein